MFNFRFKNFNSKGKNIVDLKTCINVQDIKNKRLKIRSLRLLYQHIKLQKQIFIVHNVIVCSQNSKLFH